jgi:hypothetical protein
MAILRPSRIELVWRLHPGFADRRRVRPALALNPTIAFQLRFFSLSGYLGNPRNKSPIDVGAI